ncbi:MAG: hypothetical protein ABIJ05_04180 [Patescibacteria group bacterium]
MNKKKIIIFVALILIVFVFYLVLSKRNSKNNPTINNNLPLPAGVLPTASPTFKKPIGPTIPISDVNVNNFYNLNPKINERGDVTFVDRQNFQILYFSKENEFLISILGSPFEESRQEAEKEFLKQLNINEEKACQLKVIISTPNFANPNESGQNYKLSFCN